MADQPPTIDTHHCPLCGEPCYEEAEACACGWSAKDEIARRDAGRRVCASYGCPGCGSFTGAPEDVWSPRQARA
jgi:hypothetical protein